MMKHFSLAFALAATFLVYENAFAFALDNPPWRWNADVWRLTLAGDFVHTTQNYDTEAGNYVQLPTGNYLEAYEFFPRARYNFSKSFSFYSGINGSQVTTQTGGRVRKGSAVNDLVVGSDILLYRGWAHLIASFEGGYPIMPVDTATDDPLTSNGVWYAQGKLFLYRPWGVLNSFAALGFRGRGEGLSQLLLYDFGLEVPFGHSFLLGGGIDGASTVIKDELSLIERNTVTSRVNGGSHYFYAHDPDWIEWQAWAGWSPVKSWQIKGGYAQTFNGRNEAQYPKIFLSLSFDFDPHPDRGSFDQYETRNERPRRVNRRAKPKDSFEPDSNNVDQDLFKDEDEPFQRKNEDTSALDETERNLERSTHQK